MADWRFVGGMLGIIAGLGICKDYHFGAEHLNEVYCAFDSFDVKDIKDISIDVVVDMEYKSSEVEKILESWEMAREAYLKEFGINFEYKFIMGRLPYLAFRVEDYLGALSKMSLDGDITLMFSESHFLMGNQYGPYFECESLAGQANLTPPAAVVFFASDMDVKNLSAVIVHELAHLFYAGHVSGKDCYMNEKLDVRKSYDWKFCEPTKEAIKKFKKRFWDF